MKQASRLFVYWAPRILGILFALFISIFALDVFELNAGFWKTTLGLSIHLIPTALILVILALAWKREWIGTIGFIALGILYIYLSWGRFPLSVYFLISGPLFLLGILFMVNWIYRDDRNLA